MVTLFDEPSSACIKKVLVVVVLAVMLSPYTESTHFRGATFQWRPVYSSSSFTGNLEITHHISWQRSSAEGGNCGEETVTRRDVIPGYSNNSFICREPALCRALVIGDLAYYCTDFSVPENWSVGERTYIDDILARYSYFEASFNASGWKELVADAGILTENRWSEIRMKGNLTERPDTGRINSSPTTVLPPNTKLIQGINSTIKILVNDSEGDVIRCRLAEGEEECGNICNLFPGNMTPECTIEVDSQRTSVGFYVAAIQIEDFASPSSVTPLSSVPLQFLVEFVDSRPQFVGETPVNGLCVTLEVGQTYSARITAEAISSSSISEIVITMSPQGLTWSTLMVGNPGQWYIDIVWTPDSPLTEHQNLCFKAHDALGVSSDQMCITLAVGAVGPEVVPETVTPSGSTLPQNAATWSVHFSLPFTRPTEERFIRVFNESGIEVVSIDASTSMSVVFPSSNDSRVLQFSVNTQLLRAGVVYYVTLDSGVVDSSDACSIESAPLDDPSVWRITVTADPCLNNPCDVNANCVLNSNHSCVCNPPFVGDGFNCTLGAASLEQIPAIVLSVSIFVVVLTSLIVIGVAYGYIYVVGNILRKSQKSPAPGTVRLV